MTDSFDPYLSWLGITDSERPPNHYRLLGVEELEQDVQLISRSADARMANLRRVQPGQRARQWQQLLDEMGLAKLCLTNLARKAQYDQQLEQRLQARSIPSAAAPISGDFLPPSRPIQRGTTTETITRGKKPVATAPPGANRPLVRPDDKNSRPATSSPDDRPANRPVPLARPSPSAIFEQDVDSLLGKEAVVTSRLDKKSDPSLRPIIIGSAIMLLITIAAIAWASRDRLARLSSNSTSETDPVSQTNTTQQVNIGGGAASEETGEQQAAQIDSQANPSQTASTQGGNDRSIVAPADDTDLVHEPAVLENNSAPAQKQNSNGQESAISQSPEDAAALKRALTDTRTALAKRNIPQARQHLEKASPLAKSPDQQADVARWTSMTDYVDGFWQAVDKGMRGLQPADELEVGDKIAAVVEIDLKKITLHVEGKNRSFTLSDMPASLAVALAQRWFDPNLPANKLYLGAFHVVDPKGDVAAARRLWQEATRQGASAADLMPLLSQVPSRARAANTNTTSLSEVPGDKEVTAARRAVRTRFQRELAAARSPEQKVALAEALREVAAASESANEQYALLREACDLAAGRGELSEIEASVDALAERFKIDILALKVDVLKKASDSANRDVASTLAASSLQLAEQLISDSRNDLSKRLLPVLLSAARKSGDQTLMDQAQEARSRLEQVKPAVKRPS